MNDKALVVLMTTNNHDEAEKIAEILIEKRLAACVQILPHMTSIYHWQGNIEKGAEFLMLAKTLSANFAELEKTVRENHSYTVPEIVAIKAENVSAPYFNWLKENLVVSGQ